jgi:hypothetical protein
VLEAYNNADAYDAAFSAISPALFNVAGQLNLVSSAVGSLQQPVAAIGALALAIPGLSSIGGMIAASGVTGTALPLALAAAATRSDGAQDSRGLQGHFASAAQTNLSLPMLTSHQIASWTTFDGVLRQVSAVDLPSATTGLQALGQSLEKIAKLGSAQPKAAGWLSFNGLKNTIIDVGGLSAGLGTIGKSLKWGGGLFTGESITGLAAPVSKIPFIGEGFGAFLSKFGGGVRSLGVGKFVGSLPRSLPETGEVISGAARSALAGSKGLSPIFERLGAPLRTVSSLFGRFGPLFERLGGVVGNVLGRVGPFLEELAPLFAPLIEGIGGLFAAIAAAPIGAIVGVVAAIAGVGLVIYEMVTHWDKSKSILQNLEAEFGGFFKWIGGIGDKVVGAITGNPVFRTLSRFAMFIPGVGPIMMVLNNWKNVKAFFGGLFGGFAKDVQARLIQLESLKPLWDNVAKTLGGVVDWIGDLIQRGMKLLPKLPHVDVSGALHSVGENIGHVFAGMAPGEADAIIAAHNAATRGKLPAPLTPLTAPKTIGAHIAATKAVAPAATNDDMPWGQADLGISAGLSNLPAKSIRSITTAFTSLAQAIGHTGSLIGLIAPQLLRESQGLTASTAALSGPGGLAASLAVASGALRNFAGRAALVPSGPANANITIHNITTLDGRAIATSTSRHQARSISGPRGSYLRPDPATALHTSGAVYRR